MFLAWREIRYSKTRFALIIGVVVLISYLVFFLTGLAYGLAQENRTSIDKWEADGIFLAEESNTNINMSMFPKDLLEEVNADETASLGVVSSVIEPNRETDEDAKVNATFFGISAEEFIMPDIIDGDAFGEDRQVVADRSLRDEDGYEVGDELSLSGMDLTLELVGFTEDSKFNVAPVLYTNHSTYQEIRASGFGQREDEIISAIVVRQENGDIEAVEQTTDELALYDIDEFINNLPGYNAQVLTFGLMIGFLVLIAAMIIGIFIYVLTLQKSSMLGVMKAQGISSAYIGRSVVGQTFILAAFGVLTGLILTLGTGLILPNAVPYMNNFIFLITITGLLISVAVTGAFFSVKTVVNIDPLEAID
ncbi:ABC transporter permease protein [Alkalibacterium sp. AK22]|uniref:ABC transporter permease n=1 Tax=Alkalibacterium sp. AK22 TaxID=1229520 RepID=UPI00044A9128|nr:ABC transporter permease [Alkalibacterium sp. AK22]EXJ24211.1 ABC transporter permease protein [Alkalibacterium sp. AK22]